MQPENRAVHDKLTFGMILAAAVSRKRKVNNKKIRDMKKLSNYVVAVLCVSSLAFSAGAFMKVNATPAATAAPAGQPVDLTYAAEKALPAVVHIK